MVQVGLFFDSYAIAEIIEGNPAYRRFENEQTVLTVFNLAEVYWYALREQGKEAAEDIYEQYKDAVVEIDDQTLKEAVQFRLTYKKRDLSYTDAIGYIYAKRHSLKFLTGDKEFETLPNVEFVK